jgi:hypothetical protein
MSSRFADTQTVQNVHSEPRSRNGNPAYLANAKQGEVLCPVCFAVVPPEHIGYKLHCRRCGYLESCCNPV